MAYARQVTGPTPLRTKRRPSLKWESGLWDMGHAVVAGVDEAGWGALAGPVSVGAAILPKEQPPFPLRDSKALKKKRREALFEQVIEWCTHWAVGHATHEECDRLGASEARTLASHRALGALGVVPFVLVDGGQDFVGSDTYETKCVPKGDTVSVFIAAAAVLAKVVRDRIMRDLSGHYAGYDLEVNKGYYGHNERHKDALLALGPSGVHRGSAELRKLKVKLRDLPLTGNSHHVRSEVAKVPSEFADYSQLSEWVDSNSVTRSSMLTG